MHPALSQIRAVYFDAVGTLLFPVEPIPITYCRIARQYGVKCEKGPLGRKLRESYQRQEQRDAENLWRTDEARELERWRIVVAECLPGLSDFEKCFSELWEWYARPEKWRPNFDTQEVLSFLQSRNIAVGMASNFDARLSTILAGIAELSPLQDRCTISSLISWRKPAPQFFEALIHQVGYRASEILVVGDDLANDYAGAIASGMRAILFDPSNFHRDHPDRVERLRELIG